jgi:PAS domain S-box-containing protein
LKREVTCVVSYDGYHTPPYDFRGTVLKYGEGAGGWVAETGKPLIIDDYGKWERRAEVYEKYNPFGPILCVPLIWQGQVTGAIDVMAEEGIRSFSEADLELLSLFASHASIAVENQRYFKSLEGLVDERTRKLRESEKKYRQLVETAREGVWTYDANGVVTFVNPYMSTLLGYAEEEMLGKSLFSFIDERDLSYVKETVERRRRDIGETREARLIRKDGTRVSVSATTSPIMSEDGKFLGNLSLLTDVTERKALERRLQQAERLAGIGETAAMVGHDLRNPLQGIAGAVYLLRQGSLTTDDRNEMLGIIEKNVEYSDGIVKDLLDYAGPFGLSRMECTPKEIVAGALSAVPLPSRINVRNQSQDEPRVSVDPDRMKRAVINLVENAVDAMPNEGTLQIGSKESNGFVEISFSDTGPGMSKEAIENLWRPLQTTKAKGMGMGLAIVKRIVDAHNGEISVESKMGEGTTVVMRLPVKEVMETKA